MSFIFHDRDLSPFIYHKASSNNLGTVESKYWAGSFQTAATGTVTVNGDYYNLTDAQSTFITDGAAVGDKVEVESDSAVDVVAVVSETVITLDGASLANHVGSGNVDFVGYSDPKSHNWITPTAELSNSGVKDLDCKKLGQVCIRMSSTFGTTSSARNAKYTFTYNLPEGLNKAGWEVFHPRNFSGTQNLKFYTRKATGNSGTYDMILSNGTPLLNSHSHIICILGT